MAVLNSGFPLQDNENLVLEIESKLYMTSPWLFCRFLWGCIRPILQILGFYRKGYLIVTNKRLVEYYVQTIFWFIKFRRYAECFSLKKIDGNIHWVKKGRFLFFARAYQVCYDRLLGQKSCWRWPFMRTYFILTGKEEEEANRIVSLLSSAVFAAK